MKKLPLVGLTHAETAARLGRTRRLVGAWVARGAIPAEAVHPDGSLNWDAVKTWCRSTGRSEYLLYDPAIF